MERGPTGERINVGSAHEEVWAFVPHALPPVPAIDLSGELSIRAEKAAIALARLDGIATVMPDKAPFLYSYVRKEAVLSSQIEGTQSSLSDLLLFEVEAAPGVPVDDVQEVSNYLSALEHGVELREGGLPLSGRLIREVHRVLLARGRGATKDPGEFRRSQNWIGGTRPGNAQFVPPPATDVARLISDLETFVHARDDGIPNLVRAGLAHVQFETIHPFLDGNGRVGRMLVTIMLLDAGILHEPLLYLSLYLKRNRARYYDLLTAVRTAGDWEAWLLFFLDGVRETAEEATATARRILQVFEEDRVTLATVPRRAGRLLRIHEVLKHRPIAPLSLLSERSELSFTTTSHAMADLVERGIVREITGKQRGKVFSYDRYLDLLREGT